MTIRHMRSWLEDGQDPEEKLLFLGSRLRVCRNSFAVSGSNHEIGDQPKRDLPVAGEDTWR